MDTDKSNTEDSAKDEPIVIMYDSDGAASVREGLKGWVSSGGQFFGEEEHLARFAGCTHRACDTCGNAVEKMYVRCKDCQYKRDVGQYEAMERRDWDRETPLYSQETNQYIFDFDGLLMVLEEMGIITDQTLRLVICEPKGLSVIDDDYWIDDLPEDADIPDEVIKALEKFNKVLVDAGTVSWWPGKYRTSVKITSKQCDLPDKKLEIEV